MLEPECFGCRYPGWISAGWTCGKNLVMVDDRMWIFQLSDLWNVFPVCFQHDGSSYPFSLYRSMVYHANDLYPSPSMPNISLGRPASSSVSPPCVCKFLKKRKITLFIEQEKERKFLKMNKNYLTLKKKKNVFTVNSNFSLNKINIGNIKMGE